MNKEQAEVVKKYFQNEKGVLKKLSDIYFDAYGEIMSKVSDLEDMISKNPLSTSKVYQKNFQEQLKNQMSSIYMDLFFEEYSTIDEYLQKSYEDGFMGVMYDIHNQGVPLVFPINQKEVVNAIVNNTKLSEGLYSAMGKNVDELRLHVNEEISRGIATSSSYADISRNINARVNIGRNKAFRIAKTEGHRVNQQATYDAQLKAKDVGADIVKQWDSSLDSRVRPTHRMLDGQIRELDEEFEVKGKKALFPSDFGKPEEDINCRCVILQRARWAMDDEELEELKQRAQYYGLDKTADFEEFKQKYIDCVPDVKKPKKEYLTKKKLEEKIKEMENELEMYDNKYGGDTSLMSQAEKDYYEDLKKKKEEYEEKYQLKVNAKEIKKLSKDKKIVQDEIDNFDTSKQYSGIWLDDVSVLDYESKKSKIQAKKQYFLDKINSPWTSSDDVAKFTDLYDDLCKFELEGEKYLKLTQKMSGIDSQLDALMNPKKSGKIKMTGGFAQADYSDIAKNDAMSNWSIDKNDMDKIHRAELDITWGNLSDEEKYSVWEYTRNSNPMNKPLSGYEENWSKDSFFGLGNAKWSCEDAWRTLPSNFKQFGENGHVTYREVIKDLTHAIDKSPLQQNYYVARGSDEGGFAGLLESLGIDFDEAKRKIRRGDVDWLKANVEGGIVQNHSFMSTCISEVPGAFTGDVYYEIYLPKGTKGIYAEPQSYFGGTARSHLYSPGESSSYVGNEAEIILQRGTKFRITEIVEDCSERSSYSNTFTVRMEVVEQPDYFSTGYEHTHNNGQTSEPKR